MSRHIILLSSGNHRKLFVLLTQVALLVQYVTEVTLKPDLRPLTVQFACPRHFSTGEVVVVYVTTSKIAARPHRDVRALSRA